MSHERGKAVEVYNDNVGRFHDYYRTSSDVRCKKHPQQSPFGVCAYCLEARLLNLVCSDCGVQRFLTCSCSEIAPDHRSSYSVGGCVSFLIENENKEQVGKSEEVFLINRSNSSCVEMKKKNGFSRIIRLFKKKSEKDCNNCGGVDEKSDDLWVVNCTGVSRSRSLCSFKGGGLFESEDGTDLMNFSGARSSVSAARSSGFNGGSGGDGGFNGANRLSNFSRGDYASSFIDLHVDFEAESKGYIPASSCLLTTDKRGDRKSRKSFKGWQWIFKAREK
ncbi:uncharacterized protein LOC120187420 [Hibiscus syriacus]|uniref:uncharacterized protein LOC120187420 n=1 Tax=Hibiscus syriacus TaxID=106335 RepID=UPI001924D843|nr:uncharacterized protein LOC120187420 [Hibiscus syriacus]